MASLLLSFMVIPITPSWGVADLHIGLLFFFAMAALNVYVFSYYDEATWVDFKLFGMLGLTLLFVVGQALFLARQAVESGAVECALALGFEQMQPGAIGAVHRSGA